MKVGYARVSTFDQNTETQIDKLQAAGCEKIFSEQISGANTAERTELAAAIEFARAGDVLVVTRLDRLARSSRDLLNIVHELEDKGAAFECTEQQIDTGSPTGRLQVQMLAAIAEFERGLLKERQREGIEKAKAAGKYRGRQRISSTDDVLALKAQGKGPSAIAKELGISRSSVQRRLREAAA